MSTEGYEDEINALEKLYLELEKKINIKKYMNFFKTFCKLPEDDAQKEMDDPWRILAQADAAEVEGLNAVSAR